MKDFLKKYHTRKNIGTIYMVLGALVLAFGINFFLIDETDFGKNLKTSVLEAGNREEKADLFLEKSEKNIILKNSKKIQNLISFSVSLTYNPEILNIKNFSSKNGEVSILGEKTDGMVNIILNSNGKNISKNSEVLFIEIEKLKEESTQLNLTDGKFSDSEGGNFEFTTSGITF